MGDRQLIQQQEVVVVRWAQVVAFEQQPTQLLSAEL